jgi:hypothetical protein
MVSFDTWSANSLAIRDLPWDVPFWKRIWKALERLIGAVALLAVHDAYEYVLSRSLGEEFTKVSRFLNIVGTGVFLAITIQLLWEALRVFLPTPIGGIIFRSTAASTSAAIASNDDATTEINR